MIGAQPAPAGKVKVILSPRDYFRTSPDLLTGCTEFYENFRENQHSYVCYDFASLPLKNRYSVSCRLKADYQQEVNIFCPNQRLLEVPIGQISISKSMCSKKSAVLKHKHCLTSYFPKYVPQA